MDREKTNLESARELEWNAEICEESDAKILEAGVYDFIIEDLSRSRFCGDKKMGPCAQAVLKLFVTSCGDGKQGHVYDCLYLNKKEESRLSQFFESIGLKEAGKPFQMNWSQVLYASGRLLLGNRVEKEEDGRIRRRHYVARYFLPQER